jgi:hypothetical protein
VTLSGLADVGLVAAGVWVVGSAVAPASPPAVRLAAGAAVPFAVAAAAMLQAVAGVGFLGQRSLLQAVTAVALVVLVAGRRPSLRPARIHLGATAGFAAAAAVVVAPGIADPANMIRPFDNDSHWHAGWTHQLVGGAADPGGPYAGIPNAYPWLFHALAAWLDQLLPGGVTEAFLAVQALAVIVLAAGTWLLARELGCREAGAAWAVVLAVGAGGAGWIWQHGPAAVLSLGAGLGPYHGDFVLPNAMSTGLGNLAPILPREAALGFVPLVLATAVVAARTGSRRTALVAGALLGLTALLGIDDAAVAAASMIVLAALTRSRRLAWAVPSAAGVFAIWALPLAVHYLRDGGFRSITAQHPANPSLGQAVVALGLVLPLGAAGTALLLRGGGRRAPLVAVVAPPVCACALAYAVGTGHPPLGITAFVRWLRYLPLLAIALTPAAGECAARITAAAGARRWTAAGATAALAAGACASTALAAASIWSAPADRGLVCAPSVRLGQADVVAVATRSAAARDEIGFWLFSSTGARSLSLTPHRSRVRYRDVPAGAESQTARVRDLAAILRGGAPPAGVGWVVSDLPRRRLDPALTPAAACTWRGGTGFTMYRTAGGGRLP